MNTKIKVTATAFRADNSKCAIYEQSCKFSDLEDSLILLFNMATDMNSDAVRISVINDTTEHAIDWNAPEPPAKTSTEHWYRHFREWQRELMNDGHFMLCTYPDGFRSEKTYASAPYGEHALSAFMSAKQHMNFIERYSAE